MMKEAYFNTVWFIHAALYRSGKILGKLSELLFWHYVNNVVGKVNEED